MHGYQKLLTYYPRHSFKHNYQFYINTNRVFFEKYNFLINYFQKYYFLLNKTLKKYNFLNFIIENMIYNFNDLKCNFGLMFFKVVSVLNSVAIIKTIHVI